MCADHELKYIEMNYGILKNKDIAAHLNLKIGKVQNLIKKHQFKKQGYREYAVYFGDNFGYTATKEYIMEDLRISENNFRFLSKPANARRVQQDAGTMLVNLGMWPVDEEEYYREMNKIKAVQYDQAD